MRSSQRKWEIKSRVILLLYPSCRISSRWTHRVLNVFTFTKTRQSGLLGIQLGAIRNRAKSIAIKNTTFECNQPISTKKSSTSQEPQIPDNEEESSTKLQESIPKSNPITKQCTGLPPSIHVVPQVCCPPSYDSIAQHLCDARAKFWRVLLGSMCDELFVSTT